MAPPRHARDAHFVTKTSATMNEETEKKPALQRLMDNTWLLLALGVILPFLSYTVWGWIELSMLKPALLP